jgi:hypothetical protein
MEFPGFGGQEIKGTEWATSDFSDSVWSADFMADALICGRRLRTFNVIDDFNREALQ